MLLGELLGREHQCGRSITDARRVARGHDAVLLEDGRELREDLERRLRARMLVHGEGDRPFFLLDIERSDLVLEQPLLVGGGPSLLTRERVLVALLPRE